MRNLHNEFRKYRYSLLDDYITPTYTSNIIDWRKLTTLYLRGVNLCRFQLNHSLLRNIIIKYNEELE